MLWNPSRITDTVRIQFSATRSPKHHTHFLQRAANYSKPKPKGSCLATGGGCLIQVIGVLAVGTAGHQAFTASTATEIVPWAVGGVGSLLISLWGAAKLTRDPSPPKRGNGHIETINSFPIKK